MAEGQHNHQAPAQPAAAPATAQPAAPRCAACEEWDWSNPLPGIGTGEYVTQDGGKQTGPVCILHLQDENKNRSDMKEKIDQKVASGDFDFSGAFFAGPVIFSGELKDANFFSATFSGGASFRSATFSGDADFNRATFSGDAYFRSATFSGGADFSSATFSGEANFHSATFSGDAYFHSATFSGDAYFSSATFSRVAYFSSATFSGEATFFGATFSGGASFRSATFSGEATFFSATFSGDAVYLDSILCGLSSFYGATFKGRALFQFLWASSLGKREAPKEGIDEAPGGASPEELRLPEADFANTTWEKPELIRFQNMKMDCVSFKEMDARKVDFLNVEWPSQLWNERGAASAGELAVVEKIYRQLRHNYEDSKNYPDANRFYFGEMEMRRQQRPVPRRWFTLTQLYWWSSGYCTQPWRALQVLLGLLAALTGAFMLAGLQVNAAYRAELGKSPLYLPDPIHWNLAWPAGADWAGLATWSQQACYALLHVIEVGSLSRYRHYTYLSGWDDALGVATIILLPLQLASFLLAVRRKYKR